jgi:hypothetical protein
MRGIPEQSLSSVQYTPLGVGIGKSLNLELSRPIAGHGWHGVSKRNALASRGCMQAGTLEPCGVVHGCPDWGEPNRDVGRRASVRQNQDSCM